MNLEGNLRVEREVLREDDRQFHHQGRWKYWN
jgi:hypothetical protein